MGFGAGIVGKRGLGAALMGELTVGNDGINEPLSTVGAEGMRVLEIASVGKLRLGASGKAESRFVLGTVYSKLVGLSVGRRTLGAEGLRKSNEGGVGFRKSVEGIDGNNIGFEGVDGYNRAILGDSGTGTEVTGTDGV
jgi:hypothetical protein